MAEAFPPEGTEGWRARTPPTRAEQMRDVGSVPSTPTRTPGWQAPGPSVWIQNCFIQGKHRAPSRVLAVSGKGLSN